VLENLILTPGTFDACQVDEVRQVGSFKQGTILVGHKTADFVVILKTLPTKEAIEALSNKVAEELRQTECVLSSVTTRGFDITSVNATVRVLITTVPHIFRKLDAEIHLDSKLMNEHWQAIRHSRWFEENAHHSTVKVLIRLLRDLRQRFVTLQPLSTWMLDLLAHFATMNNPNRQPFPINIAFRRTIALIAAGMYLPGSAGTTMRGHNLSYEDQDVIAATGQTLLRILAQGGYKAILGLEPSPTPDEILFSTTVFNGVTITPIEKVYEKPPEGEPVKVEEDMVVGDEDTPMEAEN
jgi:interleukin enhancer-binding factor 2